MALIVENGSIVVGAESYISVADATAYHQLRGTTLWSNLTTTEMEQALRRATDFMLQKYRTCWKGSRNIVGQPLDWPRVGVVIEDGELSGFSQYGLNQVSSTVVPMEVKNACAELALRASINTLSEDQSVRILQETIGPITTKYDQYASTSVNYVQIENMLRPFLTARAGGGMVKLSRC